MGGKKKKVTIGYKYFMGLHMGICRGPIDALRQIRVGDKVAWTGKLSNNSSTFINQPKLFGGEEQEGGIEGTLDFMTGHKTQSRNSRLSAMLGGLTSAFRGVATVFYDGLVCAMSPYPKEWAFLVQKTKAGWHNDECWYPEKCEMRMAQRILVSGSDRVWRYAVFDRADAGNYASIGFDDSSWPLGTTPFANAPWALPGVYGFATEPATVVPAGKKVWMRTMLTLGELPQNARFQAFIDNDCKLYINGTLRASVGGNNGAYYDVALSDAAFVVGENTIAVEGVDRHDGPGNWFWFDWRIADSSALEVWGMNPAHILRRLYTDPSIGRGLPASRLDEDSWRAAADKFYAEGFGLCMKWARTGSIADFAAEVINHAGAVVYTSRRTGKIVLKAIRDDYDVTDLPLYTPDTGLLGFDDDEASAQTGGINEIVVNYKDPVEKADKAVREKNLGAIMAAGGITISESVDYPGIPTEALARRVARRDLQAKSGFIKRFSVRLDLRGRDIMPGSVFRISDPARGIENMVLRAGRVEYGTIADGTITVTALQDVFGLPAAVYRDPKDNAYTPPDTSVRAPVLQAAMETPYRDLVQAMSASDLAILAPDAGYLHAAAVRPTTLSQSFALQTRVAPAAYTAAADMAAFCPGGKLAAALDYLDTTAVLTDAQALDELQPGTAALIGGEIVRVDAVDVATATLTIARGCADTVPAQHAAGTAVLCYDNWGGDDQTEYMSGVSVEAKLLTNTGAGQLSPSAATVQSVTFDSRAARPYPPGDVKFNGERYPQEVAGDLEITWAHRDRLLQADNLIDALQPSVGPEPGTTYAVELYDAASSTLLHSETGISTTTAVVPSTAFANDNRLELYSVRGGLESWQRHTQRFTWGDAPTDPHFDKVSLLLHMDGTDGSAAFTDNSPMPKMVTAYGNAKISTAQSKFGGASAYFDGHGDYLETTASSHFGYGTADFTIELWVCPASLSTNTVKVIYDQRAALSDKLPTLLTYTDGNVIYSTAGEDRIVSSAGALAVGVYTHIAIARASGVTRLFINGHLSGAAWPDATNYANSRPVIGGAGDFPSGTYNINGYIDELRITKGVARYTANFTPPTAPFPNQ